MQVEEDQLEIARQCKEYSTGANGSIVTTVGGKDNELLVKGHVFPLSPSGGYIAPYPLPKK